MCKLKQAAPDHAIEERHFVVAPGKAVQAAPRPSCRADVTEHLFASGFIADSPECICNQLPRGSQRLINPTFIVFIPRQSGCPKNRNSEIAVDRFELSRRGTREQLGSKRLHGNMEMLRPAAAFIREGLRPSAFGLLIAADPAFGKHQMDDFFGFVVRKSCQRPVVAAGKREMPRS